jgi:hypothetical protein
MLSAHLAVAGRVRPAYRFKGMRQVWFFDLEDPDYNSHMGLRR